MRADTLVRTRHAKPLIIRAGLARTFGSLVTFMALLFLLFGLYLLQDNLENPIAAQPAAVLTAAFSITLAAILFFYLLKPRRKHGGSARFRHGQ